MENDCRGARRDKRLFFWFGGWHNRRYNSAQSTIANRESKNVSVLPPHVTRQDIQLGAVLGDRATRDWNTTLGQNLNNLLIAQGRVAILVLDQVQDRFFHAGVAH